MQSFNNLRPSFSHCYELEPFSRICSRFCESKEYFCWESFFFFPSGLTFVLWKINPKLIKSLRVLHLMDNRSLFLALTCTMTILFFGASTRRLVKGRGVALEHNVTGGRLFLKRLLLSQLMLASRGFSNIFF